MKIDFVRVALFTLSHINWTNEFFSPGKFNYPDIIPHSLRTASPFMKFQKNVSPIVRAYLSTYIYFGYTLWAPIKIINVFFSVPRLRFVCHWSELNEIKNYTQRAYWHRACVIPIEYGIYSSRDLLFQNRINCILLAVKSHRALQTVLSARCVCVCVRA